MLKIVGSSVPGILTSRRQLRSSLAFCFVRDLEGALVADFDALAGCFVVDDGGFLEGFAPCALSGSIRLVLSLCTLVLAALCIVLEICL